MLMVSQLTYLHGISLQYLVAGAVRKAGVLECAEADARKQSMQTVT
jgi:hypothetical protein